MSSDVAVIGMAVRLPEADDLWQFLENLRGGRDSVREISVERKTRTSLPLAVDHQLSGYIEDIDTFDHAFFGISRGEAQHLAPEHRLLLQVAYQAVENAGYDPATLRGLRASVYVGDTKIEYDRLARTLEPTMVMGSHFSATAGRVSRFFGFRGPAAMIDSSCSSALLAVHQAVNDLVLGDAELALVSGTNLNLFADLRADARSDLNLGIRSEDGKTRCFAAEADGTGSGEAVATVVLKRLDHALRDGDPVQAVIKGIAANHVAGRSSTLTAPDSLSQAEVIERAWEKAGVDPTTISYIEAHGTATRLGDPIEVEAIDLAFGRVTSRKQFCALSSVKSNLGHTWSASGIVGLVKAVLALRHGVLFPSLHSANLSPLIDFANSAVVVTQELTPWEPLGGVRRAGVSSFGVMGTNVHAVLEEAPARASLPEGTGAEHWIPVSAKSAAALAANVAALRAWLDRQPDLDLRDIQRTLVGGRGQHTHRFCATASSVAELSDALATPRLADPAGDGVITALILSGRCAASAELTEALRRDHPHFDLLYARCESAAGNTPDPEFAFQYAFYGLLREIGLELGHVVEEGAGKHVLDASAGRIELDEALRRAARDRAAVVADLDARAGRLIERLGAQGRVVFVEAGPLSTVSRALAARGAEVVAVQDGFAAFLRDLYLSGASWRWAATQGAGRRIELPSYQFQRIRCWLSEVSEPATAPTDTLAGVSLVWKDILGLDTVDTEASFFDLGGDSISGLHLINRLQTMFEVDLDELAIFEFETPEALARYVEETKHANGSTPTVSTAAAVGSEPFAASAAQLNIWLAAQFDGGSVAFNLTRVLRLSGTVNTEALHRSVDALTDRHDALRASFTFKDGELLQRVAPSGGFPVPLETRRIDEPLPGEAGITELVREFAAGPFDLERGPLLRAELLSLHDNEHLLTVSTHHIVADGWSLELLIRDLAAFYAFYSRGVPLALPPAGLSYREQALHQERRARDRREAAAAYWLGHFSEPVAALDLPRRSGLGGAAFTGAYRGYTLPEPLWARLKSFSQAEGATVFGSVLSAFAVHFARYSEDGQLVLGTSVAGRGQESVEQLVGMLVRTLPVRVNVKPGNGFREIVNQVRSTFGEASRHSDYRYEELVQELQDRGLAGGPHLFDVLIEFERFGGSGRDPLHGMRGPELAVAPVDVTLATSVFPINIMLAEQSGTLEGVVRFDTRLFDEQTIDQLWEGFEALLDAVLDQPGTAIERLPLLSEREQRRVRTLGHRELEFDPAFRIQHAIQRFAARTPDRICLSCADDERTFAGLNARANQLARLFADRLGVRPGEVVALVMDRSILMVESILALWKCGAAYLPVDPGYPPGYIQAMLESAKVRVVATDPTRAPSLPGPFGNGCRVVELTPETAAGESAADLDVTTDETALAYVIFTSGSTGVPKGAMVEHLGMLNHLHAKIADLALSEHSVVVQNASNSFDISVWQMFAGPFAGGRTVIYEEALQLDPLRVASRLEADGVTVLEVVPSYLDTLLDAWGRSDRPIAPDALEFLLVTGEAALPRLVNRWLQRFPGVPVVNAYGPTEASDDITHHVITDPVRTDTVPLGRPIPNTLIYVLDEHLRVCPQGVRGEIYVSGIGVGRGYLNAPEQTAKAFMPDPFQPERRMYRTGDSGRWTPEGTLEFLGRTDSQVKLRGFRIDLGEIERRVSACPGVKAAAVVSNKDRLAAYLVVEPGGSAGRCRDHLARELPHHMVPTDILEIERLPLTSNGKVDRKALERLEVPRPRSAAQAETGSRTEAALARIWAEELGVDGVGLTETFFDLGGNSLRAMRVVSRVRAELNVELSLETLFTHPTIAALAAALPGTRAHAAGPIPSLGGAGVYDIALTQNLLLRTEEISAQRDAFNRNDLFELHGPVDPAHLERSFALVLERHESLRTTFGMVAGKPVQIVHEPGALAVPFLLHDFSGDPGAVKEFVEHRIRTPFDIAREPLIRADLLNLGEDRYSLLVSMHQLASDGRSVEDWLAIYEGREPPAMRLQYKDAAGWRNGRMTAERARRHREFWDAELDGASPIVPLGTDHPRPPVAALAGARLRHPLPDPLTERISVLARETGVTEFVVARCAVGLLLLAETGQTDVTIGTYTRGRGRVDLEDQIGFYINTVPLRLRVEPDDDVRCVLSRAQHDVLRAFQHEDYPYEWTMRDRGWRRGPDRSPLFDVMVAMDELGEPAAADGHRLHLEPCELPRRSKEADLLFAFWRSVDHLEIALTYNTELFTPDRADRFATHLRLVLEAMVDDRPIIEIVKQELP